MKKGKEGGEDMKEGREMKIEGVQKDAKEERKECV
jgi:hypothetical protein